MTTGPAIGAAIRPGTPQAPVRPPLLPPCPAGGRCRPARTPRRQGGAGLIVALGVLVGLVSCAAPDGGTVTGDKPIVAAATGTAPARSLTTLVTFDAAKKETPENLVVRKGAVFVSLAFASTLTAFGEDGHERSRLTLPTRGGFIAGLGWDEQRNALAVSVSSPDTTTAGVWLVETDQSGQLGSPRRLAALPPDSFPNGLTFDPQGALYVADSALGVLWRIPAGAGTAERFVSDPSLARAQGSELPAANGIKYADSSLYVSNTARKLFLRIPVQAGRPGPVEAVRSDLRIDDFAFAPDGTLLAALNEGNELVSIARGADGRLTGPATHLAGTDQGVHNPSAVAVDGTHAYLTNAAFDGPTPSPSLQVLQPVSSNG